MAAAFVIGFGAVLVLSLGAQSALSHVGEEPVDRTPSHVLHHSDPTLPVRDLTDKEQAVQDRQLAQARDAVPGRTVADAEVAGFQIPISSERLGGIHMAKSDRIDARFDPAKPEMLLVSDRSPSGRILALVYWVETPLSAGPPAGFAGPADQWHRHDVVCRRGDQVSADVDTPEQCTDSGGTVLTTGGWMLHVWVVPGEENPAGIFATERPGG